MWKLMQELFEITELVVIAMMSVPGPFNGYHEMKDNSAISFRNQLEFWNQKANIS